jgi:hypothetical protein
MSFCWQENSTIARRDVSLIFAIKSGYSTTDMPYVIQMYLSNSLSWIETRFLLLGDVIRSLFHSLNLRFVLITVYILTMAVYILVSFVYMNRKTNRQKDRIDRLIGYINRYRYIVSKYLHAGSAECIFCKAGTYQTRSGLQVSCFSVCMIMCVSM